MARPRPGLIRRLSAVAIAVVVTFIGHTPAHAQTHRAALVIQHGAGWTGPRVLFRCVEFAQEAISGLALLELAGVNSGQPPQVYDWGAGAETVCQIDQEPRSVPDRCFGPTSGPNWSDWSLSSAGWIPRPSGAGSYSIHDGDVEGWSYSVGYGTPPPSTRFGQVCPPTAAPTTRAAPAPAALTTRRAAPVNAPAALPSLATSATPVSSGSAVAVAPGTSSSVRLAPAESATPPAAAPRSSPASPLWLLLGVSGAGLIGLTALNLRRRAR